VLVRKRIKMQGFIVFDDYGPDWGEFAKAMGTSVQAGKVKFRWPMNERNPGRCEPFRWVESGTR
jgi:NADPH-dependent curcumin reductase CurA